MTFPSNDTGTSGGGESFWDCSQEDAHSSAEDSVTLRLRRLTSTDVFKVTHELVLDGTEAYRMLLSWCSILPLSPLSSPSFPPSLKSF